MLLPSLTLSPSRTSLLLITEAASSGTSTTATSLPVLKFTNVPASVYKNSVFSLTVIYYDEGLKEIIYNDPEGNYASGFDVRLSIGQAEAQDDSLGKWVIYDLVLTGTLTRELKYGSVEFSGLTLNIPGTVVYFKVEATNAAYGLSSTNTQYIAVTELTSEIEEIIAAAANQETAEIPDISTYDPELNQITADASISVGVKLGDITVEDTTSHSHFSGTFIVADYYEVSRPQHRKKKKVPNTRNPSLSSHANANPSRGVLAHLSCPPPCTPLLFFPLPRTLRVLQTPYITST